MTKKNNMKTSEIMLLRSYQKRTGGQFQKYTVVRRNTISGPVRSTLIDCRRAFHPCMYRMTNQYLLPGTIYNSAVLNISFTFIDLTYFISISMAVQVQNTTFIRLTFFTVISNNEIVLSNKIGIRHCPCTVVFG